MAYRGLDTLLEKTVLAVALVAVWSLAPDRNWGGRPGQARALDSDGVLVLLARILPPIGILVGIYIVWAGADEPGGAFQGGTIIAAMWALTILVGLTKPPAITSKLLRLSLVAGAGLFIAVGLAGLFFGTSFLVYPVAYAKPVILAIEAAMTLSIAATIALLVIGPPGSGARAVTGSTIFGLLGCVLIGIGLCGLILHGEPLRKILAFSILGGGTFLLFGVVAQRGGAGAGEADPVPQAMVITGIVVAFAATALAITFMQRIREQVESEQGGTTAADKPERHDRR